jgi:hypothetical protein
MAMAELRDALPRLAQRPEAVVAGLWGLCTYAQLYALAPGRPQAWLIWPLTAAAGLVMLALAAFMFALPLALLAALLSRGRERAKALRMAGLCLLGLPYGLTAGMLRQCAWNQAHDRLAVQAAPLIEAIEAYEADHGHPPREWLTGLIPAYLDELPSTGMRAFSRWDYHTFAPATDWARPMPKWELSVDCPAYLVGMEHFFYWPTRNYERSVFARDVRVRSGWAHYYE